MDFDVKVYTQIPKQNRKTAVAIGYFDGVHRGHAAVLGAAVDYARARDLTPTELSFSFGDMRPGGKGESDLLAPADNARAANALGIEQIVRLDFAPIASWSGRKFVEETLAPGALNAAAVFCGKNFRFGARASSGPAELREYCAALGIELFIVPDVEDGGVINTSRIKALVRDGDVQSAAQLLGRPYGFSMTAQPGRRIGRALGFPTINHRFPKNVVVPRFGVYRAEVELDGKTYRGATNIGVRPTVSDGDDVTAETFLLDFGGDIYGERAYVMLLEFLRPEQKFASKDELKAAIAADVKRITDSR